MKETILNFLVSYFIIELYLGLISNFDCTRNNLILQFSGKKEKKIEKVGNIGFDFYLRTLMVSVPLNGIPSAVPVIVVGRS